MSRSFPLLPLRRLARLGLLELALHRRHLRLHREHLRLRLLEGGGLLGDERALLRLHHLRHLRLHLRHDRSRVRSGRRRCGSGSFRVERRLGVLTPLLLLLLLGLHEPAEARGRRHASGSLPRRIR